MDVPGKLSSPRRGRRPTVVDVAERSGVSRATVSYVLNNAPGQTIPEETRARVRAAAAALGYVPSAAAASLRRGHSRLVLVITDKALTGYVTEPFLAAISERFTTAGYTALTHEFVSDEALIALIREIRPFGVLALTHLSREVTEAVKETGVPRWYSSAQGEDPAFRRPWEEEIGAVQAHHLIDRGFTRLVYAAPPEDSPRQVIARSRAIGAARACDERGLPAPGHLHVPLDRADAAGRLFGGPPDGGRTGICAFDDTVAAIVLAAAYDRRLSVPDTIAVVGVDDTPFAGSLTPPLTSLSIDARATGTLLTDRFLSDDSAEGGNIPSSARATVIQRAST
ncbi:LacI family DNA-binding transcriptional regulator [Saccharopolyspora pogona]|uniref:LacI family DNA-binding transcriptional regulator n=1 Tax=Saccharopolyspora pogona TaxID=333966 RepID=UPI0016864AA5|nr:LacI family DNA-binding transcriptional regulator [Saccharopolyspora pogona]